MPNRKPTNVLALKGSFKKNPSRKRTDPPAAGQIGSAPSHLADDESQAWDELVGQSPRNVLQASDRAALELVCCLMAEFRKDRADFTPAKLGVLQRGLSCLGFTPVDRGRIGVTRQADRADDPWARFAKS
jgi:hypothetical protein